jgi:hypothetical protein
MGPIEERDMAGGQHQRQRPAAGACEGHPPRLDTWIRAEDAQAARDRACAGLAMAMTAYAVGVAASELRAPTRGSAEAALARQAAMYLCHVAFEMSLARVAAAFRRDRSTVSHACHKMEDARDDAGFDAWIERLEEAMRLTPHAPEGERAAVSPG